jgi:Flp pilus assembly protein TadD
MTTGGPAGGWVIDVDRRWVITCHHVVSGQGDVEIVFPAWKDGRLIQDRKYYVNTAQRYKGKVIRTDPRRDLVIVQMEVLPPGTAALVLARDSGQPGDNLNMIGNPAASGAMWNYATGTLRAVYQKKFTYKDTQHEVDALIGETQLPGNPGDSGSAVFNDQGEVVGVHSGGTPDNVQMMATYIDVSEVRALLNEQVRGPANNKKFKEWLDAGLQHSNAGQWDKAVACFSEALQVNPKEARAWNERGLAHFWMKKYDSAAMDFTQAIACDPTLAAAFYHRGIVKAIQKNYQPALGDFSEATRLQPKFRLAFVERGKAYHNLGQYEQAIKDYTEAIGLDPGAAAVYLYRGWCHQSLGNQKQAEADLRRAKELDPHVTQKQ